MDDSPENPTPHKPAKVARSHDPALDLRVSDADRDAVAELLRDAYAEGRLNQEEFAERLEAAFQARTGRELAPLTGDLPVGPWRPGVQSVPLAEPTAAPAPHEPVEPLPPKTSPNIVAIFGGANRSGRWRVPALTNVVAIFGGVELDLTQSVLEAREVEIRVCAIFGGVEIKVPENVSVQRSGGVAVFGGFEVREYVSDIPGGPVVRITGTAIFGGVAVKRALGAQLKEWWRRLHGGG
ncbi:DUF1707 SHOCT-like domain-containing protein [Allostreptomyces psammosilenae]|uniref:Cell wall-active antibiotics response LiaF-like C-terminal domain-containing protein n=1 Tax=Allostreptomyces psammosilenae TaxID=1892865 RepID=A0A853A5A3_9ACTN|nr:DUF1707 domain-containing protein [Allostreptomyces psammosilenae]NYI08044.1 hypothetical protein [Allostreptomyces psammosilenae]